MINKIFSLKTNLDEISLLDNEVKIFDKIDKSILENFKIIIQKINNKKINFFTVSKDKLNDNTISLMDNKFKNFYPLDYKNIWSNYNFFKHYFEFGDYNYEPKNFIKIHLKLKRFFNFKKINSIMFFLPLYFTSYKKSNKKNLTNFILDFIPKLKLKDCTYHKKVRFNRNYGYHYEKSKKMKKKFQYVSSKLGNENSKKEYHNSIFH